MLIKGVKEIARLKERKNNDTSAAFIIVSMVIIGALFIIALWYCDTRGIGCL